MVFLSGPIVHFFGLKWSHYQLRVRLLVAENFKPKSWIEAHINPRPRTQSLCTWDFFFFFFLWARIEILEIFWKMMVLGFLNIPWVLVLGPWKNNILLNILYTTIKVKKKKMKNGWQMNEERKENFVTFNFSQ